MRYALSGWWRYSELNGYYVGGGLAAAGVPWLAALVSHGQFVAVACAAVLTVVVVVRLGIGAVRAERARRYGCW